MRRILTVLIAALVVAPTGIAAAPQGPAFGLRAVGNPKLGYFVYPGKPGTVFHGAVAVTNTGDQPGDVKIFAVDATTGSTTGAVYLTDAAPTGAGTWITLDHAGSTLAPGKRTIVKFAVNVPAGAAAGQYVGGIVAETVSETQSPKSKQKANVQIRVRNLSIVAVQVNVPGPDVATFSITSATVGGSKGHQQVLVHVANTGNVISKPTGNVTISNSSGVSIADIPFQMDTFLPHTAIDYPINLKTALPAGDYTASVALDFPSNGSSGGTTGTKATGTTLKASFAPQFSVSKESIQQVFKSSKPTSTTPGLLVASSSSSTGKLVIYGLGGLIVVLLLLVIVLLARRGRRGGKSASATHAPMPPAPQPTATSTPAPCLPFHYWDVDWDHGQVGPDGVLRYPHRCRSCGIQVAARDISEAATRASSAD